MYFLKFELSLLIILGIFGSILSCPCETSDLCNPLNTTGNQVFAFVLPCDKNVWSQFDWNRLTTIALVGFYDPQLLCHAHKNQVRVVALVDFPVANLTNQPEVTKWITDQYKYVKNNYLDGINIDIEEPIEKGSVLVEALNNFTKTAADYFHTNIPGSQVTFDVAWSTMNIEGNGIDGRNYDYKTLAQNTDFLFIMSYDEQSQFFGSECIARPNSGLYETSAGVYSYLDLGISPDKLVLGLPWYGYTYDCVKTDGHHADKCFIKQVSFRGVNCSDAAGQQIPYSTIYNLTTSYSYYWDEHSQTPYLYYTDKLNETKQVWYDNPESLQLKISFALYKKLLGVGMWNANSLDYSGSSSGKTVVKQMWDTFPKYKQSSRKSKN